jgi:hypothetical protein
LSTATWSTSFFFGGAFFSTGCSRRPIESTSGAEAEDEGLLRVADGVRLRAGAELGGVGAVGMSNRTKSEFRFRKRPRRLYFSEPKPAARI